MLVYLLVLNYNGRKLLEECLPSLLRAAEVSRHQCRVGVIDNDSTDDSISYLKEYYPHVALWRCSNRGLCSYNEVLRELPCHVAILLNNDIKMAETAIDPLIKPLEDSCGAEVSSKEGANSAVFMTAPLCWLFDGQTYEGFKTALRWRWGVVQATALFPGHRRGMFQAGRTASAGAALAVDRKKFLELGGFDPLYLPGRIEDLDFAFRGYQAGYEALYIPESVCYHRGQASFGPAFGEWGCRELALRNTLLFQWKNLRHPAHLIRQAAGFSVRIFRDILTAPWCSYEERWMFFRAFKQAWNQWRKMESPSRLAIRNSSRERGFFQRFAFHRAEFF